MNMLNYLFGEKSVSDTEKVACLDAISTIKDMKECNEKSKLMDYLKNVVNETDEYSEGKVNDLICKYQMLFSETCAGYKKLDNLKV